MEGTTKINEARELFGKNFLGPLELEPMFKQMGLNVGFEKIPAIHYTKAELENAAKEGYILVCTFNKVDDTLLNITLFRKKFGFDPEINEPCLYNQDWYLAENFIQKALTDGWCLIKKTVYESSRAVMPLDLITQNIIFPSAILCTYTFFAYYFAYGEMLWYHDFVWCEDTDHNGDRIYVGKYHDVDGVNKNGFSIHRHLALRPCYGAIGVR